MAEGWTRRLKGELIEPWSAAVEVKPIDPRAVRVVAEADGDISGQWPKHLSEVMQVPFELAVTACSHARDACPVFPGAVRRLHVAFDDPPHMADGMADEEQKLAVHRRVREEMRAFVETLPQCVESLGTEAG